MFSRELPQSPLFEVLKDEERAALVKEMELEQHREGDIIISEGDAGLSMYVISSGEVKVYTRGQKGSVYLAKLGEGDFFGEVSVLTGKPRTATITASQPTELLRLDKEKLDNALAKYPGIRKVLDAFYNKREAHRRSDDRSLKNGELIWCPPDPQVRRRNPAVAPSPSRRLMNRCEAGRRHGRDDVCCAGCRAGGEPDRSQHARRGDRPVGRQAVYELHVLINPVDQVDGKLTEDEGCLSIPDFTGIVMRLTRSCMIPRSQRESRHVGTGTDGALFRTRSIISTASFSSTLARIAECIVRKIQKLARPDANVPQHAELNATVTRSRSWRRPWSSPPSRSTMDFRFEPGQWVNFGFRKASRARTRRVNRSVRPLAVRAAGRGRGLKRLKPGATVSVGGPHATSCCLTVTRGR
jgi:hypothetical protein